MSLDLMSLDLWLNSDTFRHPEFVCMSKFTISRLVKNGKWQVSNGLGLTKKKIFVWLTILRFQVIISLPTGCVPLRLDHSYNVCHYYPGAFIVVFTFTLNAASFNSCFKGKYKCQVTPFVKLRVVSHILVDSWRNKTSMVKRGSWDRVCNGLIHHPPNNVFR